MMLRMFRDWLKEDKAVIAIEVGILMPVMMTMLLGVIDIGEGVYINQKLIDADQMMADLLTRNKTVSASVDLPNVIAAGQMTLSPYSTASFGVDIAGVQFSNPADVPAVIWRDTVNTGINSYYRSDYCRHGGRQAAYHDACQQEGNSPAGFCSIVCRHGNIFSGAGFVSVSCKPVHCARRRPYLRCRRFHYRRSGDAV